MKFKVLVIFIALLIFSIVNLYAYETTEEQEQTFKLKSGGSLVLVGDEGTIKVSSWDRDEVYLKMIKRARGRTEKEAKRLLEEIEVEIEHDDDRLVIRQIQRSENNNFTLFDLFDPDLWTGNGYRDMSVDFELRVPEEIDIRLENDEGDMDITKVSGDLDIVIDEGDLNMKDCKLGMTYIDIDEGDLNCYNSSCINERLSIYTDEGDIWLEECELSKARIDCDEGDIILKKVVSQSMEINTDEGDVNADIAMSGDGRYRFYSDEGDIFIFVDRNPDIQVKLETEDGRIRTNFDLDVIDLEDGERVRGELGSGRAFLEVYTDEGNVELNYR